MKTKERKTKRVKRISVPRDETTGLQLVGEGNEAKLLVENKNQANKAVDRIAELDEKIDKLRLKLAPLEADKELLRKGLRDYQRENEILEVRHNGFISQLVERKASFWVFEESDLPAELDLSELDEPVVPLFNIVKNKFPDLRRRTKILNKITRRVIDPVGLDDAVKTGKLAAEDVTPAFLQYVQTHYVLIKPQK